MGHLACHHLFLLLLTDSDLNGTQRRTVARIATNRGCGRISFAMDRGSTNANARRGLSQNDFEGTTIADAAVDFHMPPCTKVSHSHDLAVRVLRQIAGI